MSARLHSLVDVGGLGAVIDIECHLSNGLPTVVIVGFANKAVDEAKERLRGAFATSNILLPKKRITLNLAPADMPKDSTGFDLAMATAIMLASGQVKETIDDKSVIIGELGLDGSIRPVRGLIGKLLTGRERGIKEFFIPAANLPQALLVPHITLRPVTNVRDMYLHLNQMAALPAIETKAGRYPASKITDINTYDLSEVVGQSRAKRALEIAAAGGHNVLMYGPPGTGKSMLAKAFPSLLPAMSHEEILEVTHLHSLAHKDYDRIVTSRPIRSPHHSASDIAIIGGGQTPRPGEISLAHRGVLFLDELPEFSRPAVEALRQPLEDRHITVARAKDSVVYPAHFTLIATSNPCPCGYFGTTKACRCLPHQIIGYQRKLSGPIMDRIDMYVPVESVEHRRLLNDRPTAITSAMVRARVEAAWRRQASRYGLKDKLNADLTNRLIKQHATLTDEARAILDQAAETLDISARSYMRTLKIARTIADLAAAAEIEPAHVTEALQFRDQSRLLEAQVA